MAGIDGGGVGVSTSSPQSSVTDQSGNTFSFLSQSDRKVRDSLSWNLTLDTSVGPDSGFVTTNSNYAGFSPPSNDVSSAGSGVFEFLLKGRSDIISSLDMSVSLDTDFAPKNGIISPSGTKVGLGRVNAHIAEKKDSGVVPTQGTIEIEDGDGIVVGTSDSSTFPIATRNPPDDAVSSQNGDAIPDFKAVISPPTGASTVKDIDGTSLNGLGYYEYSAVDVKVKLQDGSGVANDTIIGDGFTVTTNDVGEAQLFGPVNTTFDVNLFEGTLSKSVTITPGADKIEFVYPAIDIQAFGPSLKPLSGVSVSVGGEIYKTDESGKVYIPKVGVGQYDVVVQDYYETTVSAPSAGYVAGVVLGPNDLASWSNKSGNSVNSFGNMQLRVNDSETGQPIRNVRVKLAGTDILDTTDVDGGVDILLPPVSQLDLSDVNTGSDDFRVSVTTDKGRYVGEEFTFNHPGNSTFIKNVELRPSTNVTDK